VAEHTPEDHRWTKEDVALGRVLLVAERSPEIGDFAEAFNTHHLGHRPDRQADVFLLLLAVACSAARCGSFRRRRVRPGMETRLVAGTRLRLSTVGLREARVEELTTFITSQGGLAVPAPARSVQDLRCMVACTNVALDLVVEKSFTVAEWEARYAVFANGVRRKRIAVSDSYRNQ
jgi:hypothetical protein